MIRRSFKRRYDNAIYIYHLDRMVAQSTDCLIQYEYAHFAQEQQAFYFWASYFMFTVSS